MVSGTLTTTQGLPAWPKGQLAWLEGQLEDDRLAWKCRSLQATLQGQVWLRVSNWRMVRAKHSRSVLFCRPMWQGGETGSAAPGMKSSGQ